MPYKFNPFTGTLDIVNATAASGVTGVPPTDINAITRWADTGGTLIKNSPHTLVQDSGAIEAQAFIFDREIVNDVTVPNNFTMISTDVQLTTGDIILDGDGELLLL